MRSAASRPWNPRARWPLRPPRLAWIGTLACAALVGVSFLIPNPQAQAIREQEAFHAEMVEQAQKVDEGATALDADAAETPELRRLLGELSGELRRAESVRDALTAVDTAERKVESLEARTARDALDAMRAAGLNALAQSLEDGDTLAAQQALEAGRQGKLLSDAAAKASDQTAAQQLSRAAQALASGEARQALSALRPPRPDRRTPARRRWPSTGMVRGAAARSGCRALRARSLPWRTAARDSRARATRRDRASPAEGPAWARPTGTGV